MRAVGTAILFFVGLALGGCAERDLEWELVFADPALESQAARLNARILQGGCPGTEVLWDEVVHPERPNGSPPTLSPGAYCFAARAGNVSCEWFASGEVTLTLPTEEMVTISLAAHTPMSNCPSGMCNSDGTCGSDPGDPPLSCPAGRCDQTCTDDCTAVCEGGGCNQICRGGAATDCNFTCPGGGCTVTCEDASTCVATCAVGDCDMFCRGGITECTFDCVGGGCNFECEDPTNCTTNCLAGGCSGP